MEEYSVTLGVIQNRWRYSLQIFFANDGKICWQGITFIVLKVVGAYTDKIIPQEMFIYFSFFIIKMKFFFYLKIIYWVTAVWPLEVIRIRAQIWLDFLSL